MPIPSTDTPPHQMKSSYGPVQYSLLQALQPMIMRLAACMCAGVLMLMQAVTALVSPTDCNDWNTFAFFQESTVAQAQDCLAAGADPNFRGHEDSTAVSQAFG